MCGFIFYGIDFCVDDLLFLCRFWDEWVIFYEELLKNNWMLIYEDVLV